MLDSSEVVRVRGDATAAFLHLKHADLEVFSEMVRGADPTDRPVRTDPKKGNPYPHPLGHPDYKRAPEFEASFRSLLGPPHSTHR
jgi:hypothetical protein